MSETYCPIVRTVTGILGVTQINCLTEDKEGELKKGFLKKG